MKITKTQLRKIIKEEVEKTIEEGAFLDFLTGKGLTATEADTVMKRSKHWLGMYPKAAGGGKDAQKWAYEIAKSEFKEGMLNRDGTIKGPEREPDPEYLKDLNLPPTMSSLAGKPRRQ